MRAMLERGLTVGAGTDATRVSSYNPWVALHWLVSGRAVSGRTLRPVANRLSREEALELYTLGGARLTGEQEVKGRLRVGCYADLAVLSADYLTVDEADIPHIESVLTVVGGRIVHSVQEHEGLTPSCRPWSRCGARWRASAATRPPPRPASPASGRPSGWSRRQPPPTSSASGGRRADS